MVFIGIFIAGCGKKSDGDILEQISGVWNEQGGKRTLFIIYKDKNLKVLFDDRIIPAKVKEIDNETKTVSLNVTLHDGTPAIWILRQINDKDNWKLLKIWDKDEKRFHLKLTFNDGKQCNLTFGRKISVEDLNRLAKAEANHQCDATSFNSALKSSKKPATVPKRPSLAPEEPLSKQVPEVSETITYYPAKESKIIERLNVKGVALTFDACETQTPSYFDEKILSYLIKEQLPFTIFMTGKFANRNRERVLEISRLPFVEIENHSFNHYQHMEKLSMEEVRKEVADLDGLLRGITGKKTKYFRFPAGNYDARTLKQIESMNYRVVHWAFPSGDADRKVTPSRLTSWVVSKTKSGDVLIFHINGRGYSTGEALPGIVSAFRKKGLTLVKLENGGI